MWGSVWCSIGFPFIFPSVILDARYSAKQRQCRCDRVSGIFAINSVAASVVFSAGC